MLQLSPVPTVSSAYTVRRNIAFEDALAQVRREDNNDDETLTDTIWDLNAVQVAVAKIVPAENANSTIHFHRITTLAEHCAGDADDVVADETDKGSCTSGSGRVEDYDGDRDRDADVDADDGGHLHRNPDSDSHYGVESDYDGDCDDDSDDHLDIAAIAHNIYIVRHGSNDHDDVPDDDYVTVLDPQVHLYISKFADSPYFCLSDEESLSVSDPDTDDKDILQAETIFISRTKCRSLHHRLHTVLKWDRHLFLSTLNRKVRFSVAQYAILQGTINTCTGRVAMLNVRSIRRTLRPALHGCFYENSVIFYIQNSLLDDLHTGASSTV